MKKIIFVLVLLLSPLALAQGLSDISGALASSTGMAGVLNSAIGSAFSTQCVTPTGKWACPLAAASLAQAANMMSSSSAASDTSAGFSSSDTASVGGKNPKDSNSDNPGLGQINSELSALAAQGYSVDPQAGTVTTPSGSVPLSALGSAKSMAGAGLIPASKIADVQAAMDKILKDNLHIAAVPVAGGGGGSGSGKSMVVFDPYNMRQKPKAPTREGLTRRLASGEAIGGQTDDIFNMIHRRYESKIKEGDLRISP